MTNDSSDFTFLFSLFMLTIGYGLGITAHSMLYPTRGVVSMRSHLIYLIATAFLMFLLGWAMSASL